MVQAPKKPHAICPFTLKLLCPPQRFRRHWGISKGRRQGKSPSLHHSPRIQHCRSRTASKGSGAEKLGAQGLPSPSWVGRQPLPMLSATAPTGKTSVSRYRVNMRRYGVGGGFQCVDVNLRERTGIRFLKAGGRRAVRVVPKFLVQVEEVDFAGNAQGEDHGKVAAVERRRCVQGLRQRSRRVCKAIETGTVGECAVDAQG